MSQSNDAGAAGEWAKADALETRRFKVEVVEGDPDREFWACRPRLRLERNAAGEVRLVVLAPPKQAAAIRKELVRRGYRDSLPFHVRGRADYGSWLNYLNEVEVAHIVVETLGWTLTPEEQAMLDAVDEYGRRAPSGFRSPRLAP